MKHLQQMLKTGFAMKAVQVLKKSFRNGFKKQHQDTHLHLLTAQPYPHRRHALFKPGEEMPKASLVFTAT
jgi:hypothetical protein